MQTAGSSGVGSAGTTSSLSSGLDSFFTTLGSAAQTAAQAYASYKAAQSTPPPIWAQSAAQLQANRDLLLGTSGTSALLAGNVAYAPSGATPQNASLFGNLTPIDETILLLVVGIFGYVLIFK